MNLPAIFGNRNSEGILKNPGDKFEARITPSGRKVIRITTNNGRDKYSVTQYSTGRIVETKSSRH